MEVTALDGSKAVSEVKAQPVIGMWALADPGTFPAPASTHLAFNTSTFGMTRLDATLQATTAFRVGIFDYRGDGRPDYRYRARVFYADSVTPARCRADGGTTITVQGVGFHNNTTATIAAAERARACSFGKPVDHHRKRHGGRSAEHHAERPRNRRVFEMTNALTYGAGPDDIIKLIQGSNPATPAGGQAPNPIQVRVLAAGWNNSGERRQRFLYFHPCGFLFCLRRCRQLHAAHRRQRIRIELGYGPAGRRHQRHSRACPCLVQNS